MTVPRQYKTDQEHKKHRDWQAYSTRMFTPTILRYKRTHVGRVENNSLFSRWGVRAVAAGSVVPHRYPSAISTQ